MNYFATTWHNHFRTITIERTAVGSWHILNIIQCWRKNENMYKQKRSASVPISTDNPTQIAIVCSSCCNAIWQNHKLRSFSLLRFSCASRRCMCPRNISHFGCSLLCEMSWEELNRQQIILFVGLCVACSSQAATECPEYVYIEHFQLFHTKTES